MMPALPVEWLHAAAARIAPYIRQTALTHDRERRLAFKWENHQVTGSFKARGALNKVLLLEDWERQAGLVTASAGNHGQGLAMAARQVGAAVKVFASDHAVPAKLERMRALGAEIELVPGGYEAAETAAIRFARAHQRTYVSPYNDGQVIAGQGTVGLELLSQMDLDADMTVLVPAGGGGLAAGIGVALAALPRRPRLVAVQAQASPFLHALYASGSQAGIEDLPTLADGLSGAVEADAVTLPLMRSLLDDFLLVSEDEIGRAIAFFWQVYGERVEGSGAVGLAAVLSGRVSTPAVMIVSGGNIQDEVHAAVLARWGRA